MDTTTKITLRVPIEVDGAMVSELNMRRPKLSDTINAEKTTGTDIEKDIAMFAMLTEQTPGMFKDMDMADFMSVQKAFQGFLL